MSNPIGNITRSAKRHPGDRLNILSFATHERYQQSFSGCNATFYLFRGGSLKDWDHRFAPVPKNHVLLDPSLGENQIPGDLDIDVILAQSLEQNSYASRLSQRLHVPTVLLWHVLPYQGMPEATRVAASQIRGHVSVTVSEYNKVKWGFRDDARVVYHGIDAEFFKPDESVVRKQQVLTVCNQIVARNAECGYDIWREATKGLPFILVGDNPPLSSPAQDANALVRFYQESSIFLNTTLVSSSPVSPLEAMAAGCAVISTGATTMPLVIEHGVNGFISKTNDPRELANYCHLLLNNPQLARQMGAKARETVKTKFGLDRFVREWDGILNDAANITFTGPPK